MRFLRFLLVIVFIPVAFAYADRTELRTEAVSEHKIKSGENLYIIAKKYNTDLRSLIRHNKLKPPYVIRIGDKLKIPGVPYHVVKKGESLSAIARKYNVGLRSVVLQNKLKKPYVIKPTQKIYIPDEDVPIKQAPKKEVVKIPYAPIPKAKIVYAPIPKREKESAKKEVPKFAYAPIPPNFKPKPARKTTHNFSDKFTDNGAQFLPPIKGKIISRFGQQGHGIFNDGINISAKKGVPVRSSQAGEVMYSDKFNDRLGNLVLIRHKGGYMTAYAHNAKNLVIQGDKVKRGQVIATIGNSGNAKEPQLHFQIIKDDKRLNPEKYIIK